MSDTEKKYPLDFDINIIKAFLDGCESQNRMNISVISSLCREICAIDTNDNGSEEYLRQCTDNIMRQCNQIMKMTEIYAVLSDSINPKSLISENVDLSEYLNEFAEECNKKIGLNFKVDYKKSTSVYVGIIKKLMDFILGMFIRKAAVNGVGIVKISCSDTSDGVIVSAEIIKSGQHIIDMLPESFSTDYADKIIKIAADKMNADIISAENGMRLIIKTSNRAETTLNSSSVSYAKHSFSTLNNLFSDLCDISLI